jgi:hypothetical protein
MTPRDLARLHRVERELEDAKQALRLIPVRFPRGGGSTVAPVLVARVIGGNTLTGSLAGIKYISSPASVATTIDPYADPALADGVGYGYFYSNGQQQFIAGPTAKRVLIYHYNSFVRYALLGGGIGEFVLLGSVVTIPGAGANSAYTIAGL